MKSVFFIPTNRNVEKCLNSYVKEVKFAREKLNMNIPIIISETNKSKCVEENKLVISELELKYPDITFIHMTVDKQKVYFDKLFEGFNESIKNVFLSEDVNYGNAMNKLFLMTCSMGADAFHRRDSDTRLIFDGVEGAKELYPIEYELKYLGKKVFEVADEFGKTDINPEVKDREIWVVGGNYFGEWNLDVKDFAKKSFSIVHHLYQLLGFPSDCIEEICSEAFQFNREFKQEEKISLVTSVNDGLNPDCGNVAVYKLHEYLPNLPGRNMLASDYFSFDTSTALGIPSVHHTREVFHEYHDERFEIDKKKRYWEGVSKFADYFNLYMKIFDNDLNSKYGLNREPIISSQIINDLSNEISKFHEVSRSERESRIKRIANEILLPFNEDYKKIGEFLLSKVQENIDETNGEYIFHAELIKVWPEIVERAKRINLQ